MSEVLKDASEFVKALLDFLRNLKVVVTVFLVSTLWLLPPVRALLRIPKAYEEIADLGAKVLCLLSGVYLIVSVVEAAYKNFTEWRNSTERRLRKALAKTSSLEKFVLANVTRRGDRSSALISALPWRCICRNLGS